MDQLYILDASGYLYRSYFAIRQMTNAKGESTNALFGFIRSVMKLRHDFGPEFIVAVFDGPNNAKKRLEIYPEYKAHRKEMPDDLRYQIRWAQQFCDWAGIPKLVIPEVEADDVMGTVAKWAEKQGLEVLLCTSDKDMCQLVNEQISVLNTHKDNLILGPAKVKEQFGVDSVQMIDFLAMTGDTSDNVPGIAGFGPKTAADLLREFGTLDYLLAHPEEIPGKKKREAFIHHRGDVELSRKLVTIDLNVPVPNHIDYYRVVPPLFDELKNFYIEHNFNSLIGELEKERGVLAKETQDLSYTLVDDEDCLKNLISELRKHQVICFDTETTHIQPLKASLVGIGLGVVAHQAWYVPVNGKLGLQKVIGALKPLFEDPCLSFYGHNVKYDIHVLFNQGIQIANISFDTILASYLLNSHSRKHSLDYLALEYFDKVKIPIEHLIGKGKKEISMRDVSIDEVCAYCCEDVDYTIRLKNILERELEERNLTKLFNHIELPLLAVLAKMERNGIYVDVPYLEAFSKEVAASIYDLEQTIYQEAGETFNLNSPKQLSDILFQKMGIKPPKKTATGYSTDAEVLESLQLKYPFVEKILEYRTLEKLRSTYIETLPQDVDPKTHRIHCTFNQSGTTTGRLSCQDPNLQNIPVRSEIGIRIREAFHPQKEGWYYLSADYSQIELRILAHLSGDSHLIEAFQRNEDIHAHTAAAVLNIPLAQVTKEQRDKAKAVNFGVIYGQQAFGLARELKIDVKEAATFIDTYFQKYPQVKNYLDFCKESARRSGKAVTCTGRERILPDINSKNVQIRAAAERLAVNTPFQGSAADLIKMAMLRMDEELTKRNKKSFMVLQIHDELIFEIPAEEVEEMENLVREIMQGVMDLKIPLLVNIAIGKNWKEC